MAIANENPSDLPLLGAGLMCGFILFGPFIDVFAKLAAATLPVGEIAVARLIVQGLILFPIAAALGKLHRPHKPEVGLHLLRGTLILLSTVFIVAAIRFMPIADAIAIFFVEPLILTLLGAVILGDTVGWRRLTACIVGFCGALLVIQPSFENFGYVSFFPLGTALCFAFYLILTRSMSRRMHPLTLQAYTSVGAVAIGIPALLILSQTGMFDFQIIMPGGVETLWLLLCGVSAAIAHLFLSFAFRYAPTSLLGPMHYLEIVTASILGYIVFGDVFNSIAATGVAIIIASGLYLIRREQIVSRTARLQQS